MCNAYTCISQITLKHEKCYSLRTFLCAETIAYDAQDPCVTSIQWIREGSVSLTVLQWSKQMVVLVVVQGYTNGAPRGTLCPASEAPSVNAGTDL